ncbi:MAG: nucleotidyltransferase family protein [Caldilineaceae bacterium]|nr:nucleotidyltransferase family protein [Caldilineaceae bacterium]
MIFKRNTDTQNNLDLTKGCWPTPHQELLLRAALLDKDSALAAWTQWRAEVNIEEIHPDPDSYHLLPLVYHNLKQLEMDDPFMQRMKGIHRRAWVENEMQWKAGVAVMSEFHAAGIAPVLLKNVPLTFSHYPIHGARPLGEWDLLVPRAQIHNAVARLDRLGWQPVGLSRSQLTDDCFAVRHAQTFTAGEGRRLAVHWRTLPDDITGAADTLFVDGAESLTVGELSARALNPTDLLLLIVVHGIAWAPLPSARWVADAYLLLGHREIDWDRLIRMAESIHTTLALRTGLAYLQRYFPALIPSEVLSALERVAISTRERDLFTAQSKRSHLSGRLFSLWQRYRHHRPQPAQNGSPLLSFARYVGAYSGHQSLSEFTRWAFSRLAQRMTK